MELHDVLHADLGAQRGDRQHCMVTVELQAGILNTFLLNQIFKYFFVGIGMLFSVRR